MLTIPWIEIPNGDGFYRLRDTNCGSGDMLQILLPEFELNRAGDGVRLAICFDEGAFAVRGHTGKASLLRKMPGYRDGKSRVQASIDGVLSGSTERFRHKDPEFVFRYANGGTLPIVKDETSEYYCFFYRDVFPVGWNIANGASDSMVELLNPLLVTEREFREELLLVMLDIDSPVQFELRWDDPQYIPQDGGEWARLERFLAEQHGISGRFQTIPFAVQWDGPGPDSIQVTYGTEPAELHRHCYLAITAEDYGIEVDRIAKIRLLPGMVIMDGELTRGYPLNRPVGLFRVERVRAGILDNASEFLPDRLFHAGKEIFAGPAPATSLAEFIEHTHLGRLLAVGIRGDDHIAHWRRIENRFGLCPVTRRMVLRDPSRLSQRQENLKVPSDQR